MTGKTTSRPLRRTPAVLAFGLVAAFVVAGATPAAAATAIEYGLVATPHAATAAP